MIHNVDETWEIERESKEWIGPLVVLLNGAPITSYTVALLPEASRPVVSDFGNPVADGSDLGVVAGPDLSIGEYNIWVRKETALEDVKMVIGKVIVK